MTQFIDYLKKFENKNIKIYVDMDGVVAEFDMTDRKKIESNKDVYLNKRPINTIINILKEINELDNVEMYILSVARLNSQIEGKKLWLKRYMPFIKENNINIIARDVNDFQKSSKLKSNFLKKEENNNEIIIDIDDDHRVLTEIEENNKYVYALHPSSILN